jgi:enoyl-CoA hydratase/carnithine racemase
MADAQSSAGSPVLCHVDPDTGICTITLNRPDARNAINVDLIVRLHAAIDAADRDDAVRAIVFTGAGSAYSVGADLSSGGRTFEAPVGPEAPPLKGSADLGGWLTLRLFECNKPLIAAVNGVAAGLGATMLLPMDVRIASRSSRFAFVFARRGIVPEACSSWFLPRIVGISKALQWSISGRIVSAEEALQGGLVDSLYDDADLLPAARAIADELTANSSPVSIALTRQNMWLGLTMSQPVEAHHVESYLIRALSGRPDTREGIEAFLEKRAPAFTSRPSADLPSLREGLRTYVAGVDRDA